MLIETANGLVEAIRELDLLDAARLDTLVNDLADRFPQSRDLGRQLIQLAWLTPYQVNQLSQGNGRHLVLGPYVLLRRIGSGGMGEVFEARHRKLQRVAAVKVISRKKLDSPVAVRRFRREAEAAAMLSHPNIVAVHDADEVGDTYYLAMEFIDGIDLAHLVARGGPLPVALACDFARQACAGLHHAHEQGMVHRDVKPQNLLSAPRGGMGKGELSHDHFRGATVKVLDMGLVRSQTEALEKTELALTQQGVVIGTMDYLAPEQARNSRDVDRRADLYALGCTLYFLLAGRPPFPGGAPLDKLLRHQTELPDPLARLRPDVPGEVAALVARLMAKKPDDRPADANEVAVALVPFCGAPRTMQVPRVVASALAPTQVIEAHSEEIGQTAAVPPRRSRRWFWPAVAGVGLLAVGLLVAGAALSGGSAAREGKPAAKHGHLADYVPADSAGVVSVRPRDLREAAVFASEDGPKFDPVLHRLAESLSLTSANDADLIHVFLPAKKAGAVMWLARGPVDREGKGRFLFAAHEGYTLASPSRDRLDATLSHAADAPAADARLRDLIKHIDHRRTLWLALLPVKLGAAPRVSQDVMTQKTFETLYERAEAVRGGVNCGKDLEARFVVECKSAKAATEAEKWLAEVKRKAGQQLPRAAKESREKRLWLAMLAQHVCKRQNATLEIESVVSGEAVR